MLKIADSHVHFWDPGHLNYSWLEEFPQINRPFLPQDLPVEGAGWRVAAVVFVQAGGAAEAAVQEVDWVASLAAADARIRGIVAFAPLEQGEAARPQLEALKQRPLVRGIRRLIQSEAPGFSLQPGFVQGVQMLAGLDLTCDLCIRHFQMQEVSGLVRQCPQVRFVLDHIGKPDIAKGRLDPWRQDIADLARLPNVRCKLSGLVTEADWQRWTPASLQPYLDHVLEAFGIERTLFGSDWPVVTLAASYAQWVETLIQATGSLSDGEREKLFYQNAVDFYRLAT
jgi:L-fuconolactonase